MVKVEFIKDFANKKAGDTGVYGSMLASTLIHRDKVAKKWEDPDDPGGDPEKKTKMVDKLKKKFEGKPKA